MPKLDWSQCPAVESIPGKVSGAWVFKDTRMPVSAIFENILGGAHIDEITEWFSVTLDEVKSAVSFVLESLEDAPGLKPRITGDFVRRWDRLYAEGDEDKYQSLVATVADELKSDGTISKETFEAIWKWKGANRVKRFLTIEDEYESLYSNAFRQAVSAPPDQRLALLLGPAAKLPGVNGPTGSTILHFMFPDTMPIIDVRTVEVLHEAGLVSTKSRELKAYEPFRHAINEVREACPGHTLRQVDRALFAYHKEVLANRIEQEASRPNPPQINKRGTPAPPAAIN